MHGKDKVKRRADIESGGLKMLDIECLIDKIKAGHVSKEAGLVFTRLPKPVEKRPWKNYFTSWRKFVISTPLN